MDQNSNMGGFAAMPGQTGFGGNPTAMPGGVQAAPNPVSSPSPVPTMPGVNPVNPNVPGAVPGAPGAPVAEKKSSGLTETIILVVVCLIAAVAIVFAVVFFMQYNDLNNTFESQKSVAIADAVETTQKDMNAKFTEQEKLPYSKYTGPSDYGSISFEYPKTWSVYVASDGTDNSDFVAYFRPGQVDPVDKESSRYALRFSIVNQQITSVQPEYDALITEGVTSSVFNADNNKISGIKYAGKIHEGIDGYVVIAKVNDKTMILQTDSKLYEKDFEALLTKLRRNS